MASTIKVDTIDTPSGAGNITISRPIVGLSGDGSALTNIVHTPADNSVTGAKLNISLLAGDTMYASGTDTLAKLAKGTAAQVLAMNAGATAPEWADAGGGAWTEKVALTTATGVTAIDLTNLTKTIKIFIQITAVQTDADSLNMRTSTNNGSSFDAGSTDYERGRITMSDTSSINSPQGGEISTMILGSIDGGMEVNMPNFSELTVFNPQLNSHTMVTCLAAGFTTNGTTGENFGLGFFAGCRDAAQVVNAVRIMLDAGGTDTFDATYFVLESTV